MTAEALHLRQDFISDENAKRRVEWKRLFKRFSLIFCIALSLLALPDSNGNTQATRLLVWAYASLTDIIHHQDIEIFIEHMQQLTNTKFNPDYRSRIDVIREAISMYDEDHPTDRAYWQQDTVYASDQQALIMLLQSHHITGLVDMRHREALMHAMLEELPESMRLSYELRPLMAGTQLYRDHANEMEIIQYYEAIKRELDALSAQQQNSLLRESDMLCFFLERTHGNIAEALADMAGFLKYMIRGVAPEYDTSQTQWILTHVLDQIDPEFIFNKLSLDKLSPDDRRLVIELMGEFYHIYGVIGPFSDLSQSIIAAGVAENYVDAASIVAYYKQRQDNQAVQVIPDITAMMDRDYAKIGP